MLTALRLLIIAALPVLLAGCVDTTPDGNGKLYTMQAWVPLLMMGIGVAVLVFAWTVRKGRVWVLLIGGLFGLMVISFGAGMFGDKVKVDPEHFELKTGFWWSPTLHDVKFAELTRMDIIAEKRQGRRGSSTSYYLICHKKSGETEKVPVGDMMKEALGYILEQSEKASVPVQNFTDR